MTSHRAFTLRWLSGVMLAAPLAVAATTAQSRETLETAVSVAGSEVTVKWSKKHPWDAELIARGISLFAEYRTARGSGLECLQPRAGTTARVPGGAAASGCFAGNPVLRGEDRTIRFQLPEVLTAEPVGQVCLQFRLADQRLLPIRRANKLGEDTARFQIDEWARNATGRTKQGTLDSRRAALRDAIVKQATEVVEQELANRGRGWTSSDACAAQTGGAVAIEASGRPIARPADQDAVARQVCVMRLDREGKSLPQAPAPPHLPNIADYVDEERRARWLSLRDSQLTQYLNDWARYAGTVQAYRSTYRVPHFGDNNSTLPLQSLAVLTRVRMLTAILAKETVNPSDVLGVVGATLEAYDRCVRDGKRQLDLNYKEAIALETTIQSLPERLRQQAVQACQAGVDKLTSMRTRQAAFEQELAAVERELSEIAIVPLPRKSRELNGAGCAP